MGRRARTRSAELLAEARIPGVACVAGVLERVAADVVTVHLGIRVDRAAHVVVLQTGQGDGEVTVGQVESPVGQEVLGDLTCAELAEPIADVPSVDERIGGRRRRSGIGSRSLHHRQQLDDHLDRLAGLGRHAPTNPAATAHTAARHAGLGVR